MIAVVCASLPLGATAFVLAQRYKLLEAETSTGAVLSTGVSVFTVSLVMLLVPQTARGRRRRRVEAVQGGGQVLFIRHATTTPGVGDPDGLPPRRLRDAAQSLRRRAAPKRGGSAKRCASARCRSASAVEPLVPLP